MQVNCFQFLSDLKQIGSKQPLPKLDQGTQRLYGMVKQLFDQGEIGAVFVLKLKERDVQNQGYLNETMIMQAYEDALREMKNQPRVTRLQRNELINLFRPIKTN